MPSPNCRSGAGAGALYFEIITQFTPSRRRRACPADDFAPRAGALHTHAQFDTGRPPNVSRFVVTLAAATRLLTTAEVIAPRRCDHHGPGFAGKYVTDGFAWRFISKGWPGTCARYLDRPDQAERQRPRGNDVQTQAACGSGGASLHRADRHRRVSTIGAEPGADGLLHNHARMWFASIWIFTLGLPLDAGGRFVYGILLGRATPASHNTCVVALGWRAGIRRAKPICRRRLKILRAYNLRAGSMRAT